MKGAGQLTVPLLGCSDPYQAGVFVTIFKCNVTN